MKLWRVLISLAFLGACGGGGPSVTLNFTFLGSSDCDMDAIDSIQYYVQTPSEADAGPTGPSMSTGNTTCGVPASFNVPVGSYTVTAYAISDSYTVNQTSAAIDVTENGNDTFTVDFSQQST